MGTLIAGGGVINNVFFPSLVIFLGYFIDEPLFTFLTTLT